MEAWALFTSTADAAIECGYPYAVAATLGFPFADDAARAVVAIVPQRLDTIKYLLGLLLSYPLGVALGLVATHVQSPFLFHLLNAVTGVAMAMWVFGPAWTVLLLFAAGAYLLLLLASASKALRQNLGSVMMVYAMTVMSVIHLHRIHVDYMGWSLDVSGPCMVRARAPKTRRAGRDRDPPGPFARGKKPCRGAKWRACDIPPSPSPPASPPQILTIKLTSLAFNMADALSVDQYKADLAKKDNRFIRDRVKLAVQGTPDILQFLGWVFCSPALLAGPAAEYTQYTTAAESVATPWLSRFQAGVSKLLTGLFFFGLTAYFGGVLPRGDPSAGDVTMIPNSTLELPVAPRVLWTFLLLWSFRFKYYGAWKLSEGAANMAGIGYTPAQGAGADNWDEVAAMDVSGFETAPNMAAALRAWNMRTQAWLTKYVYTRTPKAVQTYAVYALSAVWHGFYPGYYLTFLSAPLFGAVDAALSTRVRPRMQGNPAVALAYDAVGRVVTSCALAYTVMPFQALGYKESVAAWAAFGYAGHVIAVVALAVLLLAVPVPKADKQAEKKTL